jgi:hypothetical protein
MDNTKTEIVTLVKVDGVSVKYDNDLSAHISKFPGAKVGQKWEVTTELHDKFAWGSIVKTVLIRDV